MFMFTSLMESGFVQRINICSPDEERFIKFMMASWGEDGCIRMASGISQSRPV